MIDLDAILEYIRLYLALHGFPPTVREVQAEFGLSSTSVAEYRLKALERRGDIRRTGLPRGITIVGQDDLRAEVLRLRAESEARRRQLYEVRLILASMLQRDDPRPVPTRAQLEDVVRAAYAAAQDARTRAYEEAA